MAVNWGKTVFLVYASIVRTVSRTGIARTLLPLDARRHLGQLLRSGVKKIAGLPSEGPYPVLGHRMYFPALSLKESMVYGTYERDTVAIFQKLVKPGMNVVDIGAHIGFYTLLAARLVGRKGRVYAFEPNPEVLDFLVRNIVENGYQEIVHVIPKAAASQHGKTRLYLSNLESGEASFYPSQQVSGSGVEVETVSLDEFFAGEGWPRIDVMKVDVEGAEVEVLKGMKELVRRNRALKLIVEFSPHAQIKAVGSPVVVLNVLLDLGFKSFYAIRYGLREVKVPEDLEVLTQMAETSRYVNILCQKD